MAPSDWSRRSSGKPTTSTSTGTTILRRPTPLTSSAPYSTACSVNESSSTATIAKNLTSKLSLNRRKRPYPCSNSISAFESDFDAEVKRARRSSHLGAAATAEASGNNEILLDDKFVDEPFKMMNGHKSIESRFGSSVGIVSNKQPKAPPVATLCNLGNTCFLNSVLYTLRFTPGFLHNLHHMVHDLGLNGNGSGSGKGGNKRSNGIAAGQQAPANGSTNTISDAETELVHDVIDQLHEVFRTMSSSDESDSKEPHPPSSFLSSVGKLNPLFEGNQQQDAHEILVYILNLLQEIKIPAATSAATSALPPEANDENRNGNIPSEKMDSPSDKKSKKKILPKSTFYTPSSNNSSAASVTTPTSAQNGVANKVMANGSAASAAVPVKPAEPATLPNFVKENFVGKSVMETKCLECETSTFRSETFTNIDIPLTLDDQEETMSVKDLFFREVTASETLRENNKYWCAECSRLNEAQRSVSYEVLPRIMVLQLKRFTATGSKMNYMSKINDYIPTPLSMNCFCTECLPGKEDPKHHYRLFAVIMHLGATLASGHYIAYVRAADSMDYVNCLRNSSTVERKNKKGILKYFSRSSDVSRSSLVGSGSIGSSNTSSGSSAANGVGSAGSNSDPNNVCRSVNCCGVRTLSALNPDASLSNGSTNGTSSGNNSIMQLVNGQPSSYVKDSSSVSKDPEVMSNGSSQLKNGSTGSSSSFNTSAADLLAASDNDVWLECDDDSIAVVTRKQFEEELSSKQSATTPYLLFYQRI